jgi:hypothetical protein
MADSEALRSRRKRLHAAGDHSTCRAGCLRVADGDLDRDGLVVAVEAEFGSADPLVLALARRLAVMAVEGRGAAAVAALRALGELVAAQRVPR